MSLAFFVPLAVGAVTVVQAGLNRRIATVWGLGLAALLNALVFVLATAVLLWFAYQGRGPFGGTVVEGVDMRSVRWWWLIPGLSGLVIVAGLPWSIARVGAFAAFIMVVAAQLVTSLLWDQLAEGVSVTPVRAVGALFALVGAVLVAYR